MAKGKKVVKFHRTFRLNMAVIVFLVIFFYMLYNIFRYFTTPQVAVYEVSLGSIAQDTLYTGYPGQCSLGIPHTRLLAES